MFGVSHLTRVFKARMLVATAIHDVSGGRPGSVQFVLIDRTGDQEAGRAIASHRESRWEFHDRGKPLPFEELTAYSERRTKDRLTFERLGRYCHHMGIDLWDPTFYEGPAMILHTKPFPNTTYVDHFPGAGFQPPRRVRPDATDSKSAENKDTPE